VPLRLRQRAIGKIRKEHPQYRPESVLMHFQHAIRAKDINRETPDHSQWQLED